VDSAHFGFYAILTSPLKGYSYCANVIVDAGIRYLQLRIKDKPGAEIERIAHELRKITEHSATRFIINDDPIIARNCGADGVHIGQDDMSFAEVKKIVGTSSLIGLSTHNPQQTAAACLLAPDYIGVGPVYPTPTKVHADPVIGIEGMKQMLAVATVPAVAIGGIDCSNVRQVLNAGAKNFCMVREFTQSEEPAKALDKIVAIYREYYPEVM